MIDKLLDRVLVEKWLSRKTCSCHRSGFMTPVSARNLIDRQRQCRYSPISPRWEESPGKKAHLTNSYGMVPYIGNMCQTDGS